MMSSCPQHCRCRTRKSTFRVWPWTTKFSQQLIWPMPSSLYHSTLSISSTLPSPTGGNKFAMPGFPKGSRTLLACSMQPQKKIWKNCHCQKICWCYTTLISCADCYCLKRRLPYRYQDTPAHASRVWLQGHAAQNPIMLTNSHVSGKKTIAQGTGLTESIETGNPTLFTTTNCERYAQLPQTLQI